jgi:Mn2+/Fe2+ NRAMP family transporter
MGTHTNGRTANVVSWATAAIIGGLAIVYVVQSVIGAFSGS